MGILFDIMYLLALVLASPLILYKSLRTGKYRSDWSGRLGHVPPVIKEQLNRVSGPRLLLHCVSVGELLSTRLLVNRLLTEHPQLTIILTTTTDTGTARAKALYADTSRVVTLRYPLDFSSAVRRLLVAVKPNLIALVELEVWPNFVRAAARRNIPVVIINGRLTARSFGRYRKVRPLCAAMFRRIAWAGVQSQDIANYFAALGMPQDRMRIVPTLKYDAADLTNTVTGAESLAEALGITDQHQLFVAGSTGPGEEEALLRAYSRLVVRRPQLRLAIAPRKPETVAGVLAAISSGGFTPVRRSEHADGTRGMPLSSENIVVLDTLGELRKLYALSFAVFSGRSLVPLGGSDMIEVAALAKPCCFGPHTGNFAEAVNLLLSVGGACRVADGNEIENLLDRWLANPSDADAAGRAARSVIAKQRGSTEVYIRELLGRMRAITP
ncbi:MAG: hypothetical protein HKL96_10530 [Phycisphaerales bacterium]|nr:hypothetical protein [Phycisphaerales bacterium]